MYATDDLVDGLQQLAPLRRGENGAIIAWPRNALYFRAGILENAVQVIFPHTRYTMHSERTKSNRAGGLTRSEMLWIVVLISGIVLLIVNTLHAEVERGHKRMAKDSLAHLASQLYLGLEQLEIYDFEQLDLPRVGPGVIPNRLQVGGRAPQPLGDLLVEGAHLSDDPWGYGYVLLQGTADGHDAVFLVSVGPDDELPLQVTADTELSSRVHLPPSVN
jgi:hypothetical protein